MRWLALWPLLMVSASGQGSSPEVARTVGEEFGQGRLSELGWRFTPELQETLGPVRFFLLQRAKLADKGSYTGSDDVSCYPFEEYQACTVTVRFGDQTDLINFTLDRNGRISGFLDYGVVAPVWRESSWFVRWHPLVLPILLMVSLGTYFHFKPAMRIEGAKMLARYRWWNIGAALGFGAMALLGVLARVRGVSLLGPMLQSFGHGLGLVAVITRWTRSEGSTEEWPVRVAELGPARALPRWMWPLLVLPAAILVAAGWYAAAHWNELPEPRTFKWVFGPLLMCGSALLMTYAHMLLVVFGARRSAVREVIVTNLWPILCMQLGFVLSAVVFSVSPQSNGWVFPLAGAALALIPIQRRAAQSDDWRGGYFYVNSEDPAWVVRLGPGLSLNYGHRWIVVLAVVLLAQMAAVWVYVFAI